MARFSSALVLYSFLQAEKSVRVLDGNPEVSRTLEEFEKTLEAVTGILANQMDEKKQGTLRSLTKLSNVTLQRAMVGAETIDPRENLKVTSELLQKASEVVEKWLPNSSKAYIVYYMIRTVRS